MRLFWSRYRPKPILAGIRVLALSVIWGTSPGVSGTQERVDRDSSERGLSGPGNGELVETAEFAVPVKIPATLRLVSYNVHGPLPEHREAVLDVLANHPSLRNAHVWALQEARTGKDENLIREMARRLRLNYAYAAARPRGDGWEGLAIFSRLPIRETFRLELPHLDTGDRLRIAQFVTLSLGPKSIRLCNVHLPIRMEHRKREEQIRLIVDEFRKGLPAEGDVLIGDFNTIHGGLRSLYEDLLEDAGFMTPFRGHAKTFQKYFLIRLKVDWIYLRKLRSLAHGVEDDVTASDHRPIWVDIAVP